MHFWEAMANFMSHGMGQVVHDHVTVSCNSKSEAVANFVEAMASIFAHVFFWKINKQTLLFCYDTIF